MGKPQKPLGTTYILTTWGTLVTLEEHKKLIAEQQ